MLSPHTIEEEITFLLMQLNRRMKKQPHTLSRDLTMVQLYALGAIAEKKLTMKELAEELYIAVPTGTVLVDRLVKLGLVKREIGETDRRSISLQLTEEGKNMLKEAVHHKMAQMKKILSPLSARDKEDLKRIFQQVIANFEKEEVKDGR